MLAATFPRNVFFACFSAPFWTPLFFTVELIFSSPYSRSDLLFFVKVRFSSTLALSHLVMWTVGSVPFLFGKRSFGILANCSLCGTETTLSFLVGPVCSSFFSVACAILQAFCWSRQPEEVCHFSSFRFSLCPQHTILPSSFPFALKSLAETLFSLLLYHQATTDPRTLISSEE